MKVRWKPLLVLSGLFAIIAMLGLGAIAYKLVPKGSSQILPSARAERAAKKYDRALIHYQRALQKDGKNPSIHEEMAAMFGEWAAVAPPEKRAQLRASRLSSLASEARFGKTRKEPRIQLLAEALAADEVPESLYWAGEVLALDDKNVDAHYILASEKLEVAKPDIPEAKRHLAALEAAKAPAVRLAWVKTKLASVTGDAPTRDAQLSQSRSLTLPADANPVDQMALLRVRALDVETTSDTAVLGERVKALQVAAKAISGREQVAPNRIMRLSLRLQDVQKSLALTASRSDGPTKTALNLLVDTIDQDVETIFQQSLAAASKTDLHVFLSYADHLRYRAKRERCLEVVDQALKSPLANLATSHEVVMGLHAVAVESALSDTKDGKRFETAAPHIKELVASSLSRYQGLGHLFQGAIELEQSGVTGAPVKDTGANTARAAADPKLRVSALNHLKLAAAQLPDVVEAQARYGVALILSQEMSLGRQYLQNAMRLGNAEPQYQVWAAWSIVQAGYPEEAEPIVNHLTSEMAQGRMSRDFEGTLHLLSGEIHQARRSPEDLKKALADYDRSYAGKIAPAAVQLRMAQIDVQLGAPDRALRRIEQLRARGEGGTPAEHLAVLTLMEQSKKVEAFDTLAKARRKYPASDELAALEAALLSRDKKPKEADKVLADFLVADPENISIVLMRAQILAEQLDNVKEARRLLNDAADRSEISAPLVQLALLDLKLKDYPAVENTVAKIRARWKEAAAADLLEAQLALEQGNLNDALANFDAALKKDPGNKLVQFWKAQIENRIGASNDAARSFESLASAGSSKLLDSGLSLTDAAKSALANMALQQGDTEGAIRRFENLRSSGSVTGLTRNDRWQLISAYAAKNEWTLARREIAAMMNDSKNPPDDDERARAAYFYRLNNENDAAIAQLDYVLKINPTHPASVVIRAYMLAIGGKNAEAVALIRKAIDIPRKDKEKAPAVFYLMLAAMESELPPANSANQRAIEALDEGLKAQPKAPELVKSKYRILYASKGPKPALEFVEAEAKGDSGEAITRMLAEYYRDQQEFELAEKTLRDLSAKSPKDPKLAAGVVRMVALQSSKAGDRGDRERESALNDKIAALIKENRTKFPGEVAFLEEECELAFRRGDANRAAAVTKEIDQISKNSPAGPLLRARLFATQGRFKDVADAYKEALSRNSNQSDVRLMLGQTSLRLGDTEEGLRQARAVLDNNADRVDAILLEARALALSPGTATQVSTNRTQALERLAAAVKRQPKAASLYHQIAEIQLMMQQNDLAIATLRAGFEAVPDDAIGLAQIIELLARPNAEGKPGPEKLAVAQAIANKVGETDQSGSLLLALAVGYHKANQLESARAWADKAAGKRDLPVVHLNYGDILLSLAENTTDQNVSKGYLRAAVDQYDQVLKVQANSVEAINNKAWILHTYLSQTNKALDLAQGLVSRVNPATLPGEFFDTLGAIQESLGKKTEAEESYNKGLRKDPNHPVLNLHMGKLMLSDSVRKNKARSFLEKALAGRDRLSPSMAAEVAILMHKISGN